MLPRLVSLSVAAATLAVVSTVHAQSKPANSTPAGDRPVVLDAFSVQSGAYNGYNALQSSSGTRVAVDIKSMPFTLDVVPMEIWNDFAVQAFNQQEALSSIPGVSATENNGQFNLRGIQNGAVTGGTFFLQDGFLRMGRIDQSNVERVEVLKGPAAAIYGKNLPGGIINVISKTAKMRPEYEVDVQGGGLDFYRFGFNTTGPLVPGKLAYRFDLATSHEKAFEELRSNRVKNISGQLAWDVTRNTKVSVQYDYNDEFRGGRDGLDEAVVKTGAVYQGLAWNFANYRHNLNTSGGVTYSTFKNKQATFNAVSRLNDAMTLRVSSSWHAYHLETLRGIGQWDPTTNRVWNRRPDFGSEDRNGHAINADLLSKFKLLGLQHDLLTTADFVRDQRELGPTSRLNTTSYSVAAGFPNAGFLKEFDAAGQDPNPYPPISDFTALFRDQNSINTTQGVLINDRVTLVPDKLIVSLGGRRDYVNQANRDIFARTGTDSKISATTMQSGLNYNVTSDATLYGSYSTSISPQTTLAPNGEPFPNQKGRGYDLGMKTDLLGKRLFFTATYFNLIFDNIVQQGTDPLTNTTIFYLSGSTKSKGAELSLGGRLWDALTVRVALSRVDAELGGNLGANAVLNGLPPRSVAEWNHGTLLKYDFNQGALKGVFVGANVIAQSNIRYSDSTAGARYRVRVPGWVRFDFNAGYKWKSNGNRWSQQVSVALKNAFDIEYAYGTGPSQGNPRQVILRYALMYK